MGQQGPGDGGGAPFTSLKGDYDYRSANSALRELNRQRRRRSLLLSQGGAQMPSATSALVATAAVASSVSTAGKEPKGPWRGLGPGRRLVGEDASGMLSAASSFRDDSTSSAAEAAEAVSEMRISPRQEGRPGERMMDEDDEFDEL